MTVNRKSRWSAPHRYNAQKGRRLEGGYGKMTKWVYRFGDGKAEGPARALELLGGKKDCLAQMCRLGLLVFRPDLR